MEPATTVTADPPEPPTDGTLVLEAQRGVAAARDELARRYRRPAFLLAFQLLGDREEALDVAQDAMLRFFRTLRRFDSGRPVLPWLFRIVRNRAIDVRRRDRPADSLSEIPALEPAAPAEASPEALAGRRQLQEKVWRTVRQLTAKQREILVLRDYQDLSYAEIAAVLGVPRGTVMSRLHGARRALRARLRETAPELGGPAATGEEDDHD